MNVVFGAVRDGAHQGSVLEAVHRFLVSNAPLFHLCVSLNTWSAAGLGEARIRDLNDEINKLMREKGHWEKQIVALDGPNYAKTAPKMFDGDGRHAPGKGGYAYYGAAKDLPGVRDVYAAASSEKKRRTRGEILANVTPDYYGYRDEDDGVLLAAEAEPERAAIAEAVREFEAGRHATKRARIEAAGVAGSVAAATAEALGALAGGESEGEGEEEEDLEEEAAALHSAAFKAHVPLPSQQDIERMLLEKRKQLLLAKYATPDAMEEVTSTGGAGSS